MMEISNPAWYSKWGLCRFYGKGFKAWWLSFWHCAFRLHQHGYHQCIYSDRAKVTYWVCWTCKRDGLVSQADYIFETIEQARKKL